MTTSMTTIRHNFAAVAGLALLSGPIHGATIFNETFSDGSVATPSALNGSTPDQTTGGAKWVASDWVENGSTGTIGTINDGNEDDSAFLAFTPLAGNVYTLSATMTVPTGGNTAGWVALGFAATNTTTGSFWANGTAPWLLWRPANATNANQVVTWLGPGTSTTTPTNSASEGAYTGTQTFSIVLDTTATAWTTEWFINASSVRTETYGTNPTIGHVGFGRENGITTAIDNFSLTVVPEPSAALLGGLGLIALLRRRR